MCIKNSEVEEELKPPLEFKLLEPCAKGLDLDCPRVFEDFQCSCICHFEEEQDEEAQGEEEEID